MITPSEAAENLASLNIIPSPARRVESYNRLRHPWKRGPYLVLKSFSLPNPSPCEPDKVSFRRGDQMMLDGWEPVTPEALIRMEYLEEITFNVA